ncbi:hypothetical protein [Peribacillus sp. FSL R5-0717]|uniref:hypothetical protein n=1 Tax=Peribacillus sp. FSL R5-0717 TaxID=2975308 RepID=UPI0030F500E4
METNDVAMFYEKLGIDRRNPPDNLLKKMNDWTKLESFCCTKIEVQKLVNPQQIFSTYHSKYSECSVIEAFERSNQSQRCKKFLENPDYFFKYMKSTAEQRKGMNGRGLGGNTITLKEYKDQFRIEDGNHRVLFAKVAGIPLVYADVTVYTPDPKRTKLFRRAKEMGIILEDYGIDSESAAAYFVDELDDNSYCKPIETFKNLQEVEVFILEHTRSYQEFK